MISKEGFIERAEAVMTAINEFDRIISDAEKTLGGYFCNIYNTGIITELINCLAAAIEDKNETVSWVITERRGEFPIKNSAWINGEPVDLENWGGIYDFIQEENRFNDWVKTEEKYLNDFAKLEENI